MSWRDRLPDPISVAALAFALVMVTAAAGGGAFGSSAQDAVEDASPVGEADAIAFTTAAGVGLAGYYVASLAYDAYSDGGGGGGDGGNKYTEEDVQEILNGTKSQERADVWSRSLTMRAQQNTTLTVVENYLKDTRSSVWLKVETRMVEVLEAEEDANGDGSFTEADVRVAARDKIRDYYSTKQANLLQSAGIQATSGKYIYDTIRNQSLGMIEADNYNPGSAAKNVTYSLANGSTVTVPAIAYDGGGWGNEGINFTDSSDPHLTLETPDVYARWNQVSGKYDIDGTGYESVPNRTINPMQITRYVSAFETIGGQIDQMLSNANTTASGVYGSYVRGEFEASEFVDATAMASEWSTNYSQTGSQAYSVATLASAGYETPDLNNTGSMTVNYTVASDPSQVLVTFQADQQPASGGIGAGIGQKMFEIANASSSSAPEPVTLKLPKNTPPMVSDGTEATYFDAMAVGETATVGNVSVSITDIRQQETRQEQGLLYASDAPDGGWMVNQTYDASQLNGTQLFASRSGGVSNLGSNFSVVRAENATGEPIDQVDMRNYTYRSTNMSELSQQLDELMEIRKEQQERIALVGGGSGGGGGGGSMMALVAIIAVAGAALIINNRANGGGPPGGGRRGR